jgi:transposase
MLLMSEREWKRLDVVARVERGALTIAEAAKMLGLSDRQVQRLRKAVAKNGKEAVLHGNRGRPPPNRISDTVRGKILRLARKKYAGFNDHHFTEKLVEQEKVKVSRASVQRVLRAAGVGPAQGRRPPKHRRRRDRRAQAGLMILWDGSRHEWLEERGPMLCLMAAIDDATGELLPGAHFVEQECSAGYLRVLAAITREKGLPHSAYGDRHSALKRNDAHWTIEEELEGKQDPTQVGRALAALDITQIHALSPQAKGRVERLWLTLQDRLCSELRLAKARTVEQANAVLERYRADHNRRFTVAARDTTPAWRPLRGLDVKRLCSFCYRATVGNDNTVRLAGLIIDIPPGPRRRTYAHARVEVRQYLDGSWGVYHRDQKDPIATAPGTELGELRAKDRRKRSATTKAFGRAIERVAACLP